MIMPTLILSRHSIIIELQPEEYQRHAKCYDARRYHPHPLRPVQTRPTAYIGRKPVPYLLFLSHEVAIVRTASERTEASPGMNHLSIQVIAVKPIDFVP